jgi:lysozyme family protein
MTIDESVGWVIDTFEGHLYTDDPVDLGGATKHGITRRTLQYYRRKKTGNQNLIVTKADVKNLTVEEAVACGVEVFAVETHIAEILDWRVRLVVYDFSFHSGQGRAIMSLQQSIDLPNHEVDGAIGPRTLTAVNNWGDERGLALDVLTDREEFMQEIMERKATQRRFMLGWWKRTTKLQRLILGR